MNKILIGVGAIALVAATAIIVNKKAEKKYINPETGDVDQKDDISKFKEAASKKVTEILAWVILHKEQVEAAATLIGLVGACLGIVNAIRDFKRNDEILDRLSSIEIFLENS